MAQKVISWVLVGAFSYVWWWIGYQWSYLNVPEVDWSDVFLLFTLLSLVVLRGGNSGSSGGGDGMFDKLIATVTGFLPNLVWLIVAILVGNTIFILQYGGFSVDAYIQAVTVAVGAGVTTALWVGAIGNAGD